MGDTGEALLINAETGEVVKRSKKGRPPSPAWIRLIQDSTRVLLNLEPSRMELYVMLYMMSMMKFGNLCIVNQSEIAKKMGWRRASINEALKALEENGIIHKRKVTIGSVVYWFNDSFASKGNNHGS